MTETDLENSEEERNWRQDKLEGVRNLRLLYADRNGIRSNDLYFPNNDSIIKYRIVGARCAP